MSSVTPPRHIVDHAMSIAAMSPCRSKRGVVVWDPHTGAFRGHGLNSPPALRGCPGRGVCSGRCGELAIHAEVRALRAASVYRSSRVDAEQLALYDLVHVELAPRSLEREVLPSGTAAYHLHHGIVACDGPSCMPCASLILDVGFIGGVWLYVGAERDAPDRAGALVPRLVPQWRRYTAEEFYDATFERNFM